MFRFTQEDLEPYKGKSPGWGPVGAVTYKRTYSRPLYEKDKLVGREDWLDTCARVIEGNMNLVQNDPTATREWALEALDSMFKMAWLPPGRGLWMMGTEYAERRGGDALNNCFRAGTLVHTIDGVFPIEELQGKTVRVLSKGGVYRDAEFRSFGKQELMKLSFSNGDEEFATPGHEWLLCDDKGNIRAKRCQTKDLKPKTHRVPLMFPKLSLIPSKEGIAHGFVYGDGTINRYETVHEGTKSYGLVRFPNKVKQDAVFDLIKEFGTDKSDWKVPAIIHLPVSWKSVPSSLEITKEYALGFILGLITADGYVRGSISLHQANWDNLEKIRRLAMWVGLKTSVIRMDREISPYTDEYGPMYVFTISTATLPKELLIREDQRDKWECKRGKVQRTATIRAVEPTGLEEEVFCCTEMKTHTMVVGSGILTGQCWYVSVKPQSYEDMEMYKPYGYTFSHPVASMPSFPFVFMFDRAMLGGGVGFGIGKENISEFSKVNTEVNLEVVLDGLHPDWYRIGSSPDYPDIKDLLGTTPAEDAVCIRLEDSREGWGVAVRELIDAHWSGRRNVKLSLDLSAIRGYGTDIKGFGGTASGPLPLILALAHINRILNGRVGSNLRSIDGLDIMNLLGRCVVAGNVRRTALIALGDADDQEYINAKNYTLTDPIRVLGENGMPKWEKDENGKLGPVLKPYEDAVKELGEEKAKELYDLLWRQQNHRWASNNSVLTHELFEDFHFIAAGIRVNGEPGIGNMWLMKNFGRIKDGYQEAIDGDAEGLNPCAEITLSNCEPCNLAEVVVYRCYQLGYDIHKAIRLATQYAYRITFAKYSWPATRRSIEDKRRIGVSPTGVQDYFLARHGRYAIAGFEDGDYTKPILDPEIEEELDSWYQEVRNVNNSHAVLLKANPSIKVTTVKPSGTIAKLPGVSSGLHWNYSRYLIQRIRFHETDYNLKLLKACGYPIEPDYQAPNTLVVEFPVRSPNADHPMFKGAGDVSIEEQFANQYLFAHSWADNAVSATITFQSNEVDKIEPLLRAYSNKIKSTSLLPYSGHGYKQAPWEPITKEEYERRVSELTMTPEEAYSSMSILEEDSELIEEGCSKGVCPIR